MLNRRVLAPALSILGLCSFLTSCAESEPAQAKEAARAAEELEAAEPEGGAPEFGRETAALDAAPGRSAFLPDPLPLPPDRDDIARDRSAAPTSEAPAIPSPDPAAAEVPAGYRVEIAIAGLTYPSSVEFDDAGTLYVAECGYIPGDTSQPARILRVRETGEPSESGHGYEVVATGLVGPVTDLMWHDGSLYVSHKGRISVVEFEDAAGETTPAPGEQPAPGEAPSAAGETPRTGMGTVRDLVTDLPSLGDHSNNQLAVGPDGKIYFGQGSATNSGVVGLDNFAFGWPKEHPEVCETSAKDIVLTGEVFETSDPREPAAPLAAAGDAEDAMTAEGDAGDATMASRSAPPATPALPGAIDPDPLDAAREIELPPDIDPAGAAAAGAQAASPARVKTSAYQPFGKSVPAGTVVKGVTKANGTILRMNPDGSELEMYAWGFRNPYGVQWGPDGALWVADAGSDERGSRPVNGEPEKLFRVEQGAWHGWPDVFAGVPATDPRHAPEGGEPPAFLFAEHPQQAAPPAMSFDEHASITQIEFARGTAFGEGAMFLAASGDQSAVTAHDDVRAGYWVRRVDPAAGTSEVFFRTRPDALGPEGHEYVATAGPKRLVDLRFSPAGDALYVVDIGPIAFVEGAEGPQPQAFPGTGVVWRIVRDD